MNTPDYELWQAIHSECGDACAGCSVIEVEWPEDFMREIVAAAATVDESLAVFLHRAVAEALTDWRQ